MKKLILVLGLLASLNVLAVEKTVVLAVPGMYCAVCPITVKKSLLKLKGVKQVEASLKTKTAKVKYEDTLVKLEDLMKATAAAGYPSKVKK